MNNDVFCVFVIVASILTLAMPVSAQVLFAPFAFMLALGAAAAAQAGDRGGRAPRDRYDAAGR